MLVKYRYRNCHHPALKGVSCVRKKIKWKRILIPILLILVLFVTEPPDGGIINEGTSHSHTHNWTSSASCYLVHCADCGSFSYAFSGIHEYQRINCWFDICTDCGKLDFSDNVSLLDLFGAHNYETGKDGVTICKDCGFAQLELKRTPWREYVASTHQCLATGDSRRFYFGYMICPDCHQLCFTDEVGLLRLMGAVVGSVVVALFCVSLIAVVMLLPVSMTAVLAYMLYTSLQPKLRRKRRKE